MIKERLYIDYNATAPLSPPVEKWLKEQDMPFGNPSSVHSSGKAARRMIGDTTDFIFDVFNLNDDEFKLFFHSGATEGINSIVKGMALECSKLKQSFTFISLGSDHSCVANQAEFLEALGHKFVTLKVLPSGELDLDDAIATLSSLSLKAKSDVQLLNWTWVNNETGVVLDLNQAAELKKKFGLIVHVDGVQAPGKISQWQQLNGELDFYTFSGHKFGAMKGVGFTLCRENIKLMALINGGGQQKGMRSGTENSTSIMTLCKSLSYLKDNYDYESQKAGKEWLEAQLESFL
jgi:cysteine desulfurase